MEKPLTIGQIIAAMRKVLREVLLELLQNSSFLSISAVWATEEEVITGCGKSRRCLYRAIAAGRIQPNDIRPNPIGKGYLFRRSALIQP
ncbi:hypothetical protein [Spirosoma panaciterrae]|uniref:hypothetical protein n=1 Tax=Spirosoma panaciterrae TaxID=496058 RepID=UPI0003743066|nr:hypothetical protein [Spirosoma panaciterrae]